MKKQIYSNLAANVISQGFVFLAMAYAASVFPPSEFSNFGILMGIVSIVSPLMTFQIERVYVALSIDEVIDVYEKHLALVFYLHVILLCVLYVAGELLVAILSLSICLNQVQSYYFARSGYFKQLWLSKLLQGIATGAGVLFSVNFFSTDYLCWSYVAGWILPVLFYCKRGRIGKILLFKPFAWSALVMNHRKLLSISTVSIFLTNAIREFPVFFISYHFGASHGGSVVLVNRLLSQPMGLIGKSISPILTRYLGENSFSRKDLHSLVILFGVSAILPLAFFIFILFSNVYSQYPEIYLVAGCLIFTVFFQFCIGTLGPVFVKFRLQGVQALCYAWQMVIIIISSVVVLRFSVELSYYLVLITALCAFVSIGTLVHVIKRVSRLGG